MAHRTRPMRVVFLDFDGVLNAIDDAAPARDEPLFTAAWLEPHLVARLDALVRASDARVVISSSWRVHRTCAELARLLAERGFRGAVIDATPALAVPGREREIEAWLRANPGVDAFVVLDDAHDFEALAARVVRVSARVGLTDADVARAIELLCPRDRG